MDKDFNSHIYEDSHNLAERYCLGVTFRYIYNNTDMDIRFRNAYDNAERNSHRNSGAKPCEHINVYRHGNCRAAYCDEFKDIHCHRSASDSDFDADRNACCGDGHVYKDEHAGNSHTDIYEDLNFHGGTEPDCDAERDRDAFRNAAYGHIHFYGIADIHEDSDRHVYCLAERDADAYKDSNAYSHAFIHGHDNAQQDSDNDVYGHIDKDGDSVRDSFDNIYRNTDSDAYLYGPAHRHADCHAYN